MAKIDNAYQYFLSTYGKSLGANRYDSHDTSDLKKVYSRIHRSEGAVPGGPECRLLPFAG